MDLVVLRRLVEELHPRVCGARIDQIYALPRQDLAIVVGLPGAPRLWFSAEPDEPHLYLRPGKQPTPQRPPGFAMALRKRARGRRIVALRVVGDDRVVELSWTGEDSRLVMELIARRATAFVVDPDDRVVAVWNPRRGRPDPGEPYQPPAPRPQRSELSHLDYQQLAELPAAELRRALLREATGMTPLLAREIEARRLGGLCLVEATRVECARAIDEPTAGHLYSSAPLERLRSLPRGDALVLAPYELASCRQEMCVKRFPALNEAAAEYYELRARLRMLDRVRRAVDQPVRAQARRLERAVSRIEAELPDEQAAAALRREGDLLLAHPEADVAGHIARLADDYADGSLISVRVDPELDLVGNAQRRYRRAQRLDRKRAHGARRLAQLRRQLADLGELAELARSMRQLRECEQVLERLRRTVPQARVDPPLEPEAGMETAFDRGSQSARATAAGFGPGILRLATAAGDVILVSRNASANDRLTHQIAAQDDWWLHAEGPGSHVVLRNPQRLREPPPKALERAAGVAAWFSRARAAATVEVHWTRVRNVRRPKGGAAGKAILEGHRSIRVQPQRPTPAGGTQRS